MYNSGDAAEQVVRISLEGTEVALKLTGSAAKNIAAMLSGKTEIRTRPKATSGSLPCSKAARNSKCSPSARNI